jgi:nicotinate dehydrogenase subunit B
VRRLSWLEEDAVVNSQGAQRRQILQSLGALIVSAALPARVAFAASEGASAQRPAPDPAHLDSWIAVRPDGGVECFFGKMDMGHGIGVAIAQIVADELDVAVENVTVSMGDTARACNQGGASGSTGISLGARPLRHAAAEARRILLESASRRLELPPEQLSVTNGVVSTSGAPIRSVSYAELIGGKLFGAAVEWNKAVGNGMDIKVRATPKQPAEYRVVGKPIARFDAAGKVFGTAEYVTDVRPPGMLHARMIRPPTGGCTIGNVKVESIAHIEGARVIREGEFLAVVAEHEWDAVQAATRLQVDWVLTSDEVFPGTEALHDHIRGAPVVKREEPLGAGEVEAVFKSAARIVSAEYEWPLQSHASMGPACAVADVKADSATIWTGSQKPHSTRDGVAKLVGLPPEKVRGIWVMGPGSYGRNDAGDAALDAAYLSKLTGRPVRVQGMRVDGTAWDPKGPACVHRARAAVDGSGKVTAYEFVAKGLSRVNVMFNEADPRDSLAGMALGLPLNPEVGLGAPAESYAFGAKRLAWEVIAPLLERSSPLRTSHMRDPLGPEVHFGSEQFIDEIAAATGEDPVEFRLRYISAPRDAAVVKAAAQKANWEPRSRTSRRRARGVLRGRGIAYAQRADTVVAVVAEIEVYPDDGRIWARRLTVAHDCGLIINPRSLRNTIEGNVVQALSRTLFEEVRFDRRTVTSVDWGSYPILEMRDAPEQIDVVLIDHPELPPSGAGEPTTRCVPAAVANAFFDATGVRLRRAPLSPERVKAALAQRTRAGSPSA